MWTGVQSKLGGDGADGRISPAIQSDAPRLYLAAQETPNTSVPLRPSLNTSNLSEIPAGQSESLEYILNNRLQFSKSTGEPHHLLVWDQEGYWDKAS